MKQLRNNLLLIIGLFVSVIAIEYILFQFKIQEVPIDINTNKPDYLDFYARLGDAIGGFAGSLLSFASILFVLHTIKIQRIELNKQKEELFNQRKEYIENKIITIIYREFDRWNRVCEKKETRLDKILKPYIPRVGYFSASLVKLNYSTINQNANIDLIEEHNKVCFRLYNILFNDSEKDSEKLISFLDRAEIRNILYTIGSLFETTKAYGIYDTVLCYKQKEKDNEVLKAQIDILKGKMNYIALLSWKIFEYQIDDIAEDEKEMDKKVRDTANNRLFTFFQIDEVSNRVKKNNDKLEKPPTNTLV